MPPRGSTKSLLTHLKQVEKTTGKKPEQLLNRPKMPEGWGYIYGWYLELRGADRLTYTELKAWSDITRRSVQSWEVELIISMDRALWRLANGHNS